MIVQELIHILEDWAPPVYAEDFDNVGLLVGNPQAEVSAVLVTLDCLEEVVDEAIDKKCNTIVTFHPIIFKGLQSITGKNYVERVVIKAIQNNIAIYAMHTNLDKMNTGVNYKICEVLGLENSSILLPEKNSLYKLITYVPKENVQNVLDALYAVGAGNIGEYENCSFSWQGEGTFTPVGNAKPYQGSLNKAEKVQEQCLQLIVQKHQTSEVLKALKKAHPYDEVAYELLPIANINQDIGMGMIGELSKAYTEEEFLKFLKNKFTTTNIRHSRMRGKPIRRVAVLGGSGSFALSSAIAQGADAFVSGDFKYHDFFQAENKILITDIGHFESEQFTKNLISEYITKKNSNFAVQISKINTNPIYNYS